MRAPPRPSPAGGSTPRGSTPRDHRGFRLSPRHVRRLEAIAADAEALPRLPGPGTSEFESGPLNVESPMDISELPIEYAIYRQRLRKVAADAAAVEEERRLAALEVQQKAKGGSAKVYSTKPPRTRQHR